MSKIVYVSTDYGNRNTAASKAPRDIEKILDDEGALKCTVKKIYSHGILSRIHADYIFKCIRSAADWKKVVNTLEYGDILFAQTPIQMAHVAIKYIKKAGEKAKTAVIIHDLETLRNGVYKNSYNESRSSFAENTLLKEFDFVICHNHKMKKYLADMGIVPERLISLGIFDYLCEDNLKTRHNNGSIVIAGNLSFDKSEYIYKFSKICKDVTLRLYGPNCMVEELGENTHYMGQCAPEEIPRVIDGAFGLVWDGNDISTCAGNTGNYLKYNNPHKLSLYIAANMPVIVWSESAMADYVREHNIGICVDNLDMAQEMAAHMNEQQYEIMAANVKKEGEKLRQGCYMRTVIDKISLPQCK